MFMTTHDRLLTNTTNRQDERSNEDCSKTVRHSNNQVLRPTAIHHSKELPFLARREEFLVKQI